MKRAKELGMTHLPQTNHGTLMGHREFQIAAAEAGIIPILGVEAYISSTDRFDKRSKAKRTDGTNVYNHMILLAQNETGLQSLRRLNEIAWTEGFYNKPRIDIDALEEHNEGLIVTSGCMSGLISAELLKGDLDQAMNWGVKLKSILGDRFFIEVQGHNDPALNAGLLLVADTLGIRPVITSDCHYARKEDLWIEEAMLILSTNPKPDYSADLSKSKKMGMLERFNYLYPDRTMTFEQIEIYLRGAEDHLALMAKQGVDRTDIVTNTMLIADMIEPVELQEGLELLPVPKNDSPDALLARKARAGLKKKGLVTDEYTSRLEEELDIIKDKEFSTYFLIVSNMIEWAKKANILVGPGRGSAAGSLVCYALGITQVDPIKENLLFFRFINPKRNDFPDIDTDFEDRRRKEVKDYLRRQFVHVASIATKTMFQGKNAVRAAARVFRIPLGEVNTALKGVEAPPDRPEQFFDLFKESPKGKAFIKAHPEVMKLAHELSGRIQSTGMHAAGVVIANQPLRNVAAIETASDPKDKTVPRVPLVALDMEEVADLGLVKLDVLGLKTLTVVHDTLDAIKNRYGIEINPIDDIPTDDSNVFGMLSEGFTKGVFQCEAVPYTNLILKMGGVGSFDELVASNALVRPGAMNTIGAEYIKRKNGKAQVKYAHPIMEAFTSETYGEVLYQEQVMLTMTELAGMSMAEADKVRKIIGKKKDVKEFDAFKDKFIEGATKNVSQKVAEGLWHDFEAHAGYSFNKSHAVAYSLLSYWTAWLKFYYPKEFIYAILKNEQDKDVRTEYLIEAKRLGIKIILPHVEKSDVEFSIEDNGIRFGLSSIKFISTTLAKRLIEHRPYNSYAALEEKVMEKGSGLNSRVLASLNAIGAAAYEDNQRSGKERDNFYEYLSIPAFETAQIHPKVKAQFVSLDEYSEEGAFPILAMVKKIKRGAGWARVEVVDETGTAGIFAGEDTPIEPGQMYAILVSDNRVARYMTVDDLVGSTKSTFKDYLYEDTLADVTDGFYRVIAFKSRKTKAGKMMANAVFATGDKELLPVLVFPQQFPKAHTICKPGETVMATLNTTDDGSLFLSTVER